MEQNVKFNKGIYFEEQLINCLIIDNKFSEQMAEVLCEDYFSVQYLKEICRMMFDYYNKYKTFPSKRNLCLIVDKIPDGILKDQIKEYLVKTSINMAVGDMDFIKEESLEFCKKRKLVLALEESLKMIEEKNFDQIGVIIQKALQKGTERDLGHYYDQQFEQRMLPENRVSVPTGWKKIDDILRGGGVARGELCVVCAISGMGKSHMLVDLACSAAKLGKTVAFYTLELTEIDVGNRIDSNLSKISFDHLKERKEEVRLAVENLPGKIIIKSFSAGSATVQTLRNHLNRLKINNVFPELIVIDYADLMKIQKDSSDSVQNAAQIFKELKGFASEISLPVWTCTQANREAIEEQIITSKHIAQAYAKIWATDLFITFNSPKKQNEQSYSSKKYGNLFICKSRLGPDSIVFSAVLDTSMSSLEFVDPSDMANVSTQVISEEDKLRQRLRQLKNTNDKLIN